MRYLKVILLLSLPVFLQAQRIADFSLAQSGSSVTTHFTLRAGNVCSGYRILHSADSITYLEVVPHNMPCGTSGADEFFTDVHSTPVPNQYNYYKVQLFTFETSEVKKIWVGGSAPQALWVFPNPGNPLINELRFRIPGFSNTRVQGFVRDLNGYEKLYIDQVTTTDNGRLDVAHLAEGLFTLWLTDGTNVYKGKFIVVH